MKFIHKHRQIIPFLIYVFFILKVSAHPQLTGFLRVIFIGYAIFLFSVVWRFATDRKDEQNSSVEHQRFYRYLLWGSVLFFVVTRTILFIRYGEAPLGYDTGFYLRSFDNLLGDLDGARAFRTLLWIPLSWLGAPPLLVLHGIYVLVQLLILGAVYTLTRMLSPFKRLPYATIAVFLFVMSVPQFFAYWWMFYQMELAIAFLLISIALFHRRSILVLLTAGFGAAIHPATFLPLIIAVAIFLGVQFVDALMHRRRLDRETVFMFSVVLAGLFVVRYFGSDFLFNYLHYSTGQYGWFYTNFPPEQQLQFTGLYIDLSLFRLTNIYLLPFSALGILLFVARRLVYRDSAIIRRMLLLMIMVGILFFMTYYPFIYKNRFLILLDLVLIIFAIYPFVRLVQYFFSRKNGKIAVGILIFGFVMFNAYIVITQKPQLYPDELEEIRAINLVALPTEYAMTTESIYTPWVLAFSGRQVIDPGYLAVNKWNYEMWKEFWEGDSNARRHELLQMYDRPMYIFVGKIVPDHIRYKRFITTDPRFIQVSPHVWWYDPQNATAELFQ